jgi:hypothetical protein
MIALLSRAVMTLASSCLGNRHREWALAMRIELEAAIADGNGLDFSIGCLVAAWRELPAQAEGRLLLARYALALGLILPLAALLSSSALLGFPQLDFGHLAFGAPHSVPGHIPIVNDGNRTAAPVLALLVLLVASSHILIAWFLLDCDWNRVARTGSLAAAITVTLAIFTSVAALGAAHILLPLSGLIAELAAISALARLHARQSHCAGFADPAPDS